MPYNPPMTRLVRTVAAFAARLPLAARFSAGKRARIDTYTKIHMRDNPVYADPKRLNRFEFQVYSQSGEDGIIAEIFKRIGTTNRFFVECGAGNGYECNSLYLLMQGWTGLWIEANPRSCRSIRHAHKDAIDRQRLFLKEAPATAETIETILREANTPPEPDFLSIDIDGNDYWIWKSIQSFRPRVVVIEYNALHRPPVEWIMPENNTHQWKRDAYYGASLSSMETLGKEKGYTLVGCNFSGGNAFFVRNDLIGDLFVTEGAIYHYEPLRMHLLQRAGAFPVSFAKKTPVHPLSGLWEYLDGVRWWLLAQKYFVAVALQHPLARLTLFLKRKHYTHIRFSIGDSHSMFTFRDIPGIVNVALGPVTMHRVGRDGLDRFSLFRKESWIWPERVLKHGDSIYFSFGEIDCRCHIEKERQKGRSLDDIVTTLADLYVRAIVQVRRDGIGYWVVSVTPPAYQKYLRFFHSFSPVGSDENRALYTEALNEKLKYFAAQNGIAYLDIYSLYADDKKMMRYELSDTRVHVGETKPVQDLLDQTTATTS